MTLYFQESHPPAFKKGTRDFARFYGMLIDGIHVSYVNGFGYNQVVPAPDSELPARAQRAEQVFAQKLWREQLREWDEKRKPAAIAMHRELQSINPDTLSDTAFLAYLTRCRDHHAAMMAQHMEFTAGAIIPTGDFLVHVTEWTNLSPSDLLGLMRGSAEVSSGGSDEMARLRQAFAEDVNARALLASDGEPDQVLADLRGLKTEAGSALSDYLDLVGNRLVDGFDIAEPSVLELPDALLRSIRLAVVAEAYTSDAVQASIADARAHVPAAHQAQFDELLGEARLTYRLRDERGVYSDIWAAGLMRRAVLSAGRRAASQGRITRPPQMLDASFDEMCALLTGARGPSADELDRRANHRARYTAKDAAPLLGPPVPPPSDLSGETAATGRLMRATFTALGHLFMSSTVENEEKILYGLGASKGVYEGIARRVSGPAQFDLIKQGDVLVTESTTEAFNILLPLLGGIVTDNGGLLSHAAIVSREYGVPGVVGTSDATQRIANGTRVRVDGGAGEVTILE